MRRTAIRELNVVFDFRPKLVWTVWIAFATPVCLSQRLATLTLERGSAEQQERPRISLAFCDCAKRSPVVIERDEAATRCCTDPGGCKVDVLRQCRSRSDLRLQTCRLKIGEFRECEYGRLAL
ncbi:phosphoesterase involved in downregulation of the unfolded protein response [Pseudozyma hubeiensis SY62]|uniref:Phosphoesterase involved in downregulation of the unfolded protein response n=1 Tax=Pseudozyma hubeiensis (strain SY62) TaxID=1305764 RepID=R9NVK4_PSEHS|nr:phosphoesterase involved in downregulation of the unfolded protein response [Pseudozyma hubeiensis SY62]GAC92474.1 phosphoesterase involved in downregulation of the unfolded protein response [Pseudozyma hubeiensis SY62]